MTFGSVYAFVRRSGFPALDYDFTRGCHDRVAHDSLAYALGGGGHSATHGNGPSCGEEGAACDTGSSGDMASACFRLRRRFGPIAFHCHHGQGHGAPREHRREEGQALHTIGPLGQRGGRERGIPLHRRNCTRAHEDALQTQALQEGSPVIRLGPRPAGRRIQECWRHGDLCAAHSEGVAPRLLADRFGPGLRRLEELREGPEGHHPPPHVPSLLRRVVLAFAELRTLRGHAVVHRARRESREGAAEGGR